MFWKQNAPLKNFSLCKDSEPNCNWDLQGLTGIYRTGIYRDLQDWDWLGFSGTGTELPQDRNRFRPPNWDYWEKQQKPHTVLLLPWIKHGCSCFSSLIDISTAPLCCHGDVRRLRRGRQLGEVAALLWCHCQDVVDGEFDFCRMNQYFSGFLME